MCEQQSTYIVDRATRAKSHNDDEGSKQSRKTIPMRHQGSVLIKTNLSFLYPPDSNPRPISISWRCSLPAIHRHRTQYNRRSIGYPCQFVSLRSGSCWSDRHPRNIQKTFGRVLIVLYPQPCRNVYAGRRDMKGFAFSLLFLMPRSS